MSWSVTAARRIATRVATNSASHLTSTGATLHGTVDPDGVTGANYYFEYGRSVSYGSITGTEPLGTCPAACMASAAISGVLPNAAYHFQLVVTNAGAVTTGGDLAFTTTKVRPTESDTVRPSPVPFGSNVSLRIHLRGRCGAVAGSVLVTFADETLCSASLAAGVAHCTVRSSTLGRGSHTFVVHYLGSGPYRPIERCVVVLVT
ncbi:MAG: hypothetical protein WAL35_00275 [Acidimicrobiales bacterium]